MNELLVTVMNSASQIMQAQAINTNNLANASTDGFRSELAYIESTQVGGGVYSEPDLSVGGTRSTGRELDISINGRGWIGVVGNGGIEAYSRRGDLQVDSLGQLSNGAGQSIMGNNGPISLPPFASLEIGSDGTISIQPLGQSPNTLAVVDRIKLVTLEANQISRGEDGLMYAEADVEVVPNASITVQSGTLESSNVNAVSEMIKMIDLARRFENQVKLMESANANAASLSKILGMS